MSALEAQGQAEVTAITAPRLQSKSRTPEELIAEAKRSRLVGTLAGEVARADVVVNVAGDPDASSRATDVLFGANALLPRIILEAAASAGVDRLVHVSSAAVQNDKAVLDASEETRAFSPYSASKVGGEQVLQEDVPTALEVVRFRPPSVHAPGRRVTRLVARVASSPFATVATPGAQPTPQALLPNVAAAVAFLTLADRQVPPVVIHPWEGVTVESLMRDLGGRQPRKIPQPLAAAVVAMLRLGGRLHGFSAANARRLELLWLGQQQDESWLTGVGWMPPVGVEGWRQLIER